jgi:hypothetical protein
VTTHWKSRRLATRAKKVVARHADKPAIHAFKPSIDAKADAYIVAYDASAKHEATWRRELAEGKGAMAILLKEIDSWKPHLVRERPGFDLTTIGDRATVPEDLIQDAIAAADELEAIRGTDGTAPAWAIAGAAGLRQKAEIAERESDEAALADSAHNTQLADVREKKVSFDAELSLLRNTLRAQIGRNHPDFQKLRAEKAGALDAEDDPSDPIPAPPVPPAPPIA